MTEQAVLDEYEAGELSVIYDSEPAQEIVAWALEMFHPRMAISEGGGAEGMLILDMAVQIEPNVRVFTLDTGRLPQETYDLVERVKERYGIQVEMLFPEKAHVEGMTQRHGPNLMYDAVDLRLLCCQVRKVLPLSKAAVPPIDMLPDAEKASSLTPTTASMALAEVDETS